MKKKSINKKFKELIDQGPTRVHIEKEIIPVEDDNMIQNNALNQALESQDNSVCQNEEEKSEENK